MSTIEKNTPLGELVDTYPLASTVLLKHGLDFCCGGGDSLANACKKAEVDLEQILNELEASRLSPAERQWSSASTEELVQHILEVHHSPLPNLLAQVKRQITRVVEVHGSKDPDRLNKLKDAVHALSDELLPHMMKEEQILFPWILSGRMPPPMGPIQVMLMEHEAAGKLLEQVVTLTDNFQPPSGACTTWRNLYALLQHLDQDLRTHIHLENNILFAKAVA